MKLFAFNSNKKQATFVNIVVISVSVLLMLGQVKTIEDDDNMEELQGGDVETKVGLADHVLKKGKVTLAEGSKAAAKEDMEQYAERFAEKSSPDKAFYNKPCDVKLDDNGNIILLYSKGSTATKEGCTVDLLTSHEKGITFTTSLNNVAGLPQCAESLNGNVLPFAYNQPDELELHKSPKISDDKSGCNTTGCINDLCIKQTGLELRWKLDKGDITFFVYPIGGLSYQTIPKIVMAKLENKKYPTVEIDQSQNRYKVSFPGTDKGDSAEKAHCVKATNILSPITWGIETSPDPKKTSLLVFHLLPQAAARMLKEKEGKYQVENDHPNGPECDELNIIFQAEKYALLTLDPPTTTTTTTTTEATTTTTITTTTTTTTTPTTTTEEPSSPIKWIIIPVVLLVCSSCGGAAAYFFIFKGSGDDGTKSKMEKSKMDKSKMGDKSTKSKRDNTKSLTDSKMKDAESAAEATGSKRDDEVGKEANTEADTAIDQTKSFEEV